MEELRKIETGMVPVYETSTGEKVVYGTELYKVLGSKRQYTDWIKSRFSECDAIEGEDYEAISQNCEKPTGGRPKHEYIIRIDIAKEMAMLERNQEGKQVRRYFIQLEKKYKVVQAQVAEKIEEMASRIDNLENMLSASGRVKITSNPFIPGNPDFSANLKRLDHLTGRVAELCGISKTKTLHYLYLALGEQMSASIDSYMAVYRRRRAVKMFPHCVS